MPQGSNARDALSKGIVGHSKMRKHELIDALKKAS